MHYLNESAFVEQS